VNQQVSPNPPTGVDRIEVDAVNAKGRRQLYKAREKIFPKRVYGSFRTLKWWVMGVTLTIYYLTPWIRWERGAGLPDQAVLVDLAHRRFYFFFIEIWPQEFYYVAGLLIMAGIGLFLVTSTVGRAWCGYACPQTVWVDLFIAVERWIEGDRNARIKLEKAPWTPAKVAKRVAVHGVWLVIAFLTGGAWIFYFADAPMLAREFVTGQAAPIAYSTVAVLTATTYVLGGLMREQVCTYMCPWPRIQAAMLDEDSLVVTYNDWRGEPRSRHRKRQDEQQLGDCIDCNLCVAACPMGIDIRDGEQLECITCALCIDACNGVMEKIGKPRGLISYATLNDYEQAKSGAPQKTTWRSIIRPRTVLYITIWSVLGLALLATLATRDRLDIDVLHDRNPVFVRLSSGDIRNGYTVKILNMLPRPRRFELRIEGLPGATMTIAELAAVPTLAITIPVDADRLRATKVFVRLPRKSLDKARTKFTFVIDDLSGDEQARYAAVFQGPEK